MKYYNPHNFKKIKIYSLLFININLAIITLSHSQDIKTKFPISRYDETIQRSPFHINIINTNPIQTKKDINLDLVGISKINNVSTVFFINKITKQYISVKANEKNNEENIQILEIIDNQGDPRETKVKISQNDEIITVGYSKTKITASSNNATQPDVNNYRNKKPNSHRKPTQYTVVKNNTTPNRNLNKTKHNKANIQRYLQNKTKTSMQRRRRIIPQKWNKN